MKSGYKSFKEFQEWHKKEGAERRVRGGDKRKTYNKELEESDEALKSKAEKSGISLGILKQVYNRGMAAYKTGHRPGTTAQQWALARVNSFITKGKGTWGGADKDLAAKVGGGTKKEQAPCWDGYKQVGMKKKGNKMVPDCVPESVTGAEKQPFKSKAGAGEFASKELEKKYRKSTPGQPKKKIEDATITEKLDYDLYHKTFSAAMQHSYKVAKKRGFKVSADSIDTQVAFGPRKPSNGKTNSYHLDLDGERNKKLRVQVYNTGKSYELNMYIESMELNERMSRRDFEKLKKGDKVEINYGSTVSSSQTREFSVVNKSRSAKYDVDKVRLQPTDKTGGMKFFLYSRKGGDATLALGDMGASIKSYKLTEEVELDENLKKAEKLMGPSKNREQGIEFVMKGLKVSKDKATKMVDKIIGMKEELQEKKYSPSDEKNIQKTISIMKQYPANKKKSDKELRDGAIEYLFHNRSMKRKRVETTEGFSAAQLGKLKKAYSTVSTVDPTSSSYKKLTKMIKSQDKEALTQIAKAKVNFVSQIAATELRRSHNIKLKASEFMEEIEMNESEFKTVRGKDGKNYDVKISMDGKKFKFRVTNKTGNIGAFKVMSLGQAAKLFENLEELVDITEENGIELARKIVDRKQHMKGIDLTTAGLILQVYDKVNDKNKSKMEKMSGKQLASVVYKMLSKEEVQEEHDMYGYKLFKEEVELEEATGKEIAALMKKSKTMKGFAAKVAKMKTVTVDDLEDMLPDYVSGGDIRKMFETKNEGITDEDVAQFIGAASAAKKAGKKNFSFGGKTYPVTISGDTAKKVLEDSLKEAINEKMDPRDHVEKNKESGMYCVYDGNGDKVKEFEDKKEAEEYAIKNHKKLMSVVKESKYTDIEELIESSDKKDAAEMSKLVKELQPKISNSELKKEVHAMAMEKYKNKARAKKIASFA
tara:strand:- start:1420 stop:4218 length:2799 start_codon:yes stop_codon:yes gene_type:complete